MLIKILCHNTINEADVHKSLFLLPMHADCVHFRNMCTLIPKNTGVCWCGAVLNSSSPLLRITKLQGEQEARQGLVGSHEDAIIIKTVSDFPVSLPSLPRQARALPDAAADSSSYCSGCSSAEVAALKQTCDGLTIYLLTMS